MGIEIENTLDDVEDKGRAGVKKLVCGILREVLDKGYDLGGLGEYGRGWNDRGVQIKTIVEEMTRRWRNDKT